VAVSDSVQESSSPHDGHPDTGDGPGDLPVQPQPVLVFSGGKAAGILAAFLLQVLFSQWRVMNLLFETSPMTANQWLACFGLASPMLLVALLANRRPVNWVPPQLTITGAG
jgi:hypothetical protein